ncbi:MAG TPA: PAS domain S-box protein [Roseomonas sp.]|jgi:PAS domain S-box-containing protein
MGALIRAHDWTATPLGPIAHWPQSLRVAVRLLLNTRHPMFIWWGPELIQLYNDAYRDTMGPEHHPAALGAGGRETWAEVWDTIGPQIDQVMAGHGATWHEDQLVPMTRNGQRQNLWWTYSCSPIDDDAAPNGIGGVLVICQETTQSITDRKLAEQRLRESETQFQLMADAVPQIVWITDAEGRVEFFSRQWTNYTGASYEPTTAAEVAASFVHPDDAALTMERFEEARRTHGTFLVEHRIRSKDGFYRWFLVRGEPYHDPGSGEILRWFGTSVDIHDRKQTEEALRASETRLRIATEANGIGTWELTIQGGTSTAVTSPRHNAIFGYAEPVPEWNSEILLSHVIPEDREVVERALRHGVDTGEAWSFQARIRQRRRGELRWIEAHAQPVEHDAKRQVVRVIGIVQDITARKAAEERQALLTNEMDHRAKNALAVVQSALRLTPKEDAASYAAAVEGRVGALARAQTLLAEERWNGAGLHALLEGELAPFLSGQAVDLDGPPAVLPASIAQPLAMAVHELATNAVKYGALSEPEGRVSVSWRFTGDAPGILRLRWMETGGPPITGPPTRRGFGSRVLEGTVRRQLGGVVSLAWGRTGLVCEIEVPIGQADAPPEAAQARRTASQ